MNVGNVDLIAMGEQPPRTYPVMEVISLTGMRRIRFVPAATAAFFKSSSDGPGITNTKYEDPVSVQTRVFRTRFASTVKSFATATASTQQFSM